MLLTTEQIVATGEFLLRLQHDDGALPWFRGGQWDAWNHTEAVMGLTVAGVVARTCGRTDDADRLLAGARLGLDHLRETQRPDGSWPMSIRGGAVEHHESDTNQCAYPAVGVWHYALATGEMSVCETYWRMIRAAFDLVLRAQLPLGPVAWALNDRGELGDHALVTGCSSILQSLWAARAVADVVGVETPIWKACGERLARAVADRPDLFRNESRHSMDWFYPVLGGALHGQRGLNHLRTEWDRYVWEGEGIRCVDDNPWVTGGETAEFAMALACLIGEGTDEPDEHLLGQARTALDAIGRRLRDETTGGYWTGYVVPDDAHWPEEQTGWTAGAMLMAVDALDQLTPAGNFFHAMTWPTTEETP